MQIRIDCTFEDSDNRVALTIISSFTEEVDPASARTKNQIYEKKAHGFIMKYLSAISGF